MNKLEKKMKKRIDNNLNQFVKNPYSKPKKSFPLWGKVMIPVGGFLAAATACLVVLLPLTAAKNGGYGGAQDATQSEQIDKDTNMKEEATINYNYLVQLRAPNYSKGSKTTDNEYSTDSAQYKSFKQKMQVLSTKLTQYLIESDFEENENIALSPLSIELCLGLAARAAKENTRKQILDAFDLDFATFDAYYKRYFMDIYNEKYSILTNSIWINNGVPLLSDALDDLRDDYYCYSYYADFFYHISETNKEMADFVSRNTNNFLNPIFDFGPKTLFVLMNTVYWRDYWNEHGIDLSRTAENYKFKNSDDSVSNKTFYQAYYEEGKALSEEKYDSFYAVTCNGFKLHFIKAKNDNEIKDLMNEETISYITNRSNYITQDDEKLEKYSTRCVFPEFAADYDEDITPILQNKLNITDLFNDSCDLTNLIDESKGKINAWADKCRHIAKIEVTKKGVEAAATTVIDVPGQSSPGDYTYVYEDFVIDNEFGFVLTYKDAIVFSGIVSNVDK